MDKVEIRKAVISWILTFVVAIAIAQVLTRFVVVNASIPSESMQNTVMEGDKLFANRLAYINSLPKRGDIIIFKYPVDESRLFIKRVIGLPNETVEIIDGKIYIDGSEEPLVEDYLPEEWIVGNDGYRVEVPSDSYFVLGDNRNNSSDARFWPRRAVEKGLVESEEAGESYRYVPIDKIEGKAWLRYWPLNEIKVY